MNLEVEFLSDKPKAYSYIRMSTDAQRKGDSYRRQLKLSEDYAQKNGLELVKALEDIGVSAFRGKHLTEGALGEFVATVEAGNIEPGSYFLIESLDRISRESILNALALFNRILQKEIVIVTLADQQKYTRDSVNHNPLQMYITLGVMVRANEESKTKSSRLIAAWKNKRTLLETKKLTSICPAWLTLDKNSGEFTIQEEVARCVKKIYELSIDGYGADAISKLFNNQPILFPPLNESNGWHKSYVQKILNNPAVYGAFQAHKYENGKRVPDGELVQNYFPAVISEHDFFVSKLRISKRKKYGARRKGVEFSNIFTRIIRCSSCDGLVVFRNKGDKPKGGTYLQCGTAVRRMGCGAPSWGYEDFEGSFLKFVRELDLTSLFNADQESEEIKSVEEELRSLEYRESAADLRETNLYESLMHLPSAVHLPRIKKLIEGERKKIEEIQPKILKLRERLFELTSRPDASVLVDSVAEFQEKKQMLDADGLRDLRHKMYNAIAKIIEKIEFRNSDRWMAGDDIKDLREEFLTLLKAKRYVRATQKEDYLLTQAGQRTYVGFHRSFTVHFKNGVNRYVEPSIGLVLNFDPLPVESQGSATLMRHFPDD